VSERDNSSGNEQTTGPTSWSSPNGLDLNPRPPQAVRISRRASLALVGLGIVLLGLFAYGGWKRRQRQVAALADANLPKRVAPATAAAADIVKDVPSGNVPTEGVHAALAQSPGQLQPPEDLQPSPAARAGNLNFGPPQPYFAPVATTPATPQIQQPTPEEQRLQAAYDAEQRAMASPTAVGTGVSGFSTGVPSNSADSSSQLTPALRPFSNRASDPSPVEGSQADATPAQAFLFATRTKSAADYLNSSRTPPISEYEIKAGWEIPAVMEQGLNSDLPGEVKALVTSNVYDTATGRYILIPQGARLVGEYNSQLGYGQDVVEVVWNRVIYPDGSSMDLNGMLGQDEHGFSGFRDKVDRHYKRLIGFAVLTSMFAAASNISQTQNRSVLVYPSPAEVAGSAVGQQVSDLGAQITRKNLNVQPTIRIPVGYRFDVRVNRDIAFDSPYKPFS